MQGGGQIEENLRSEHEVKELPEKVKLSRSIALTLILRGAGGPDNAAVAGKDDLRTTVRAYQPTRITLDRDEMERRMFACKLLLVNREAWHLDRFETAEYCDQLLGLCRRATRPARSNSDTTSISFDTCAATMTPCSRRRSPRSQPPSRS